MYAIVEVGGHQVRVEPGAVVTVDRLGRAAGERVEVERVLLVEKDGAVRAGSPYVAGVTVVARVEGEVKGPKIRVFKKKRRKGYRRTRGHRSLLTRLRIEEIVG